MFKNNVLVTNKNLRNFCIYRLLFGISYTLIMPIMPLFFDSIGMSTIAIGTVMSLYGVSKTLAQVPSGIFTGIVGDKNALKIALLIMGILPIFYITLKDPDKNGLLYIVQGGLLGMAAPATYSLLSRAVDSKKRGECTGYAAAVFTVGGGLGAGISGFIVTKLNDFKGVFILASFGILISLIFVMIKIPKIKVNSGTKNNKVGLISNIKEIKRRNLFVKVLVLASISFLGDYIYGCVISLFHFYGVDVLGGTISYTSLIISIYLIVFGIGAPIAGFICDKIGKRKQLFLAFLIMNSTLAILLLTRNIPIFTITIILYFLGATLLNSALQSSLSEFGDFENIKGFIFGVVGGSESLGFALGPLFSAYIYEKNKELLFLGLLMVSLIVTLIYLVNLNKAKI